MHNQPENRSLMRIVKQINSRIWVNFTRNGLRLGSRHQEPPHTDVSRNLATVVVFLLLSHSWTTDNVRGVLPGLGEEELDCCPVVQSPLFRWEQVLYFIWKPRSLESGGRVEKLIAQFAWSPVLSFHSLWWFGCHVICWCWSIVFFENQRHCTRLPRNLEHFRLPSADQLFKDADFIFQQDLAPAHTAKSTKSWLNDQLMLVCLTGQQTHQTWTP